jgi:hypothetical protein
VVLSPGKEVAVARDAVREKSIVSVAERGVSIAARFSYLKDPLKTELSGIGLDRQRESDGRRDGTDDL